MVKEWNRSIDAIKGLLIFCVIIGHILLGTLDENIIRYTIYSFHMPTFFFISGYLINLERLNSQNYRNVFTKYWKRMLGEWILAWVVYSAYSLRSDFNVHSIIYNLYQPWYHLWFVPSLFIMVSILWLFFQFVKNINMGLALLIILSILFYNLSNTDFKISPMLNCCYFPFLLLGIIANRNLWNVNHSRKVILAYIIIVICINLLMNSSIQFFRSYIELPLVAILCIWGILPIIRKSTFHGQILEYWGKHSLRIYLWHVIPILGLKWIFIEDRFLEAVLNLSCDDLG